MALEVLDQARLGLERHGVGDQAAAGLQGRPGRLEHAGIGQAAADEHGVRRRQARERRRRAPSHDLQDRACRARRRCAPRAPRAPAASSMPIAFSDGWRSSHSMAIEPAPRPTSHSSSPCARRQRRERDGAHLALGELAVMLEQAVVEAGCERRARSHPATAPTSRAMVLSGATSSRSKSVAVASPHALARAAHGFQHGDRRTAHAALEQQLRQLGAASRRPTTERGCARRAADGARCLRARGHAG